MAASVFCADPLAYAGWRTGNGAAAADFDGTLETATISALSTACTFSRVPCGAKVQRSTVAGTIALRRKTVDQPLIGLTSTTGTLSDPLSTESIGKISGLSGSLQLGSTAGLVLITGCAGDASFRIAEAMSS